MATMTDMKSKPTRAQITSKGKRRCYVALMRGVNVGGQNKLPMKHLIDIFDCARAQDVRTYIQTGNVIFSSTAVAAKQIASAVRNEIERRHAYNVPVVIRSAAALRRVVAANPFLHHGAATEKLHVAFLAKKPTAAMVKELDPDRSPGDRYELQGSEIYLYCPNGMARTKLTNAYFDAQLSTTSTIRNWRTVLKLVELAGG